MDKHNQHAPKLPKSVTPWWQDGNTTSEEKKEPYFLSGGIFAFMQSVWSWLLFPLQQMDALTCSESLLKLMAWDRDIQRFDGEPLTLFRKRVKFAAINAKDAGSVAGFIAIFDRLGIGHVEICERLNGRAFDVVRIRLSDEQLAINHQLLNEIIRQYGRTCRRYEYEVLSPVVMVITPYPVHWEHQVSVAEIKD